MIDALDIHVKGIVQGVGFRPFVYKLAKKYLINGWVLNAVDGVHIRAEGESEHVDGFVMELSENAPAAAQVTEIEMREVPIEPFDTFEIRFSEDDSAETTFVSPDLATCDQCTGELFNASDRRFRYPFINCTNCGPRFTIIEHLPYDRPSTSMSKFAMCAACDLEYTIPTDRRFHAQPNACFECGPHVSWSEDAGKSIEWGLTRVESDAIFARAVKLLREGGIIAVKGLGGFHLACDANNAGAVAKLRERKHRFGKAFAVMVEDAEAAKAYCHVSDEEAAILASSVRPIVLLRKRANNDTMPGVADGLPELGVMLPYTPVQLLLMNDFAEASVADELPAALVMTSGNMHDESICIKDDEAYDRLADIADAFLGNDREILSRFDDSVVRVIKAGSAGDAIQMIRRARGYAPTPIAFSAPVDRGDGEVGNVDDANGVSVDSSGNHDGCDASDVIFAAGPEQKNTFALMRLSGAVDDASPIAEAFVSQHIGDMENADTFEAWLAAKDRMQSLFDLHPNVFACDLHPEYITTKWAHEQAAIKHLPLTQVQHHHAHVASVMAESGFKPDQAVCGIAFDGTGFGADGNIWGGEVLLSNMSDYERFANFAYVPMPGGAAAIKHPLQMAYGVLWEFDLLEHPGAQSALAALGESQCELLESMIEQGINTPVTSSVGRLFDAASALLGVCTDPTYEGEPAIMLEAAMHEGGVSVDDDSRDASNGADDASLADDGQGIPAYHDKYSINIVKNTALPDSTAHDTSVVLFDAAGLFGAMLDDLQNGVPVSIISRKFHDAFVEAIVSIAQLSQMAYDIRTVVLTGGVFMNRYLIEHAISALEQAGFTVAINRDLPPNDGCVSFGQAVVCLFQKR